MFVTSFREVSRSLPTCQPVFPGRQPSFCSQGKGSSSACPYGSQFELLLQFLRLRERAHGCCWHLCFLPRLSSLSNSGRTTSQRSQRRNQSAPWKDTYCRGHPTGPLGLTVLGGQGFR